MKKLLLVLTLFLSFSAGAQVFVPSAFTPNRDGLNDSFKLFNTKTEKVLETSIFNRFGGLIYHTQNNAAWEGTFNGVQQDNGVYFYQITYLNDSLVTIRGTVTLLR